MGWISSIIYIIVVIAAISAWINSKIALEEIESIKKHLGITDEKPIDFENKDKLL